MYRWSIIIGLLLVVVTLACEARSVPAEETQEQNLSGYDFHFTDLQGRDLSGKNLQEADFSYATLWEADLRDADLRKTNLNWTDLRDANLSGANLIGAKLEFASLKGANFEGAKLDDKWTKIIDLLTSGSGPGQDFSNFDLSSVAMSVIEYDLSKAKLYKANLEDAYIPGINLTEADLRYANLKKANLSVARLYRVNMTNADLQGATLHKANLQEANLTGANLDGVDLNYANLTGVQGMEDYLLESGIEIECAIMPNGKIKVLDKNNCETESPPFKNK